MLTLRADCSSCCGLCCVVPDQLTVQGFGFDKPAESHCRHLNSLHHCSIYAARPIHGYTACKTFDCFGAGQWITRLFDGADWTDSLDLARRMFAAYRHWVPRFEAAALLGAALPHVRDDARDAIRSRMTALTCLGSAEDPAPTNALQLRRETLAMIHLALRNKGDVRSPRS